MNLFLDWFRDPPKAAPVTQETWRAPTEPQAGRLIEVIRIPYPGQPVSMFKVVGAVILAVNELIRRENERRGP